MPDDQTDTSAPDASGTGIGSRLKAMVHRDPGVLHEIALTFAATTLFVVLAAWTLSRVGDRVEQTSADLVDTPVAANGADDVTEVPLVRYRGPAGVAGVGDVDTPVRVAEVDLLGLVRVENPDEAYLVRRYIRGHKNRLAEDVDSVLRSATAEELADPAAEAIRGRIRERVDRSLPSVAVERVAFGHYRVFDVPAVVR
ncbi:MAG: hypothetical protein AAF532_09515 [Planctomycetota bacterium]